MTTTSRLRAAATDIFSGLFFVIGGVWLWYSMVGNPFHDLALIRRAETVHGFIIDTWEHVNDGDDGRTHWSNGATYKYTLPDGSEVTQSTGFSSGRLKDEFRDLEQPYPIEVEYLPDNPNVSRIKGNGSSTIFDWVWRKAGLGSLLLAIFVAPGISVLRAGIRKYRVCEQLLNQIGH